MDMERIEQMAYDIGYQRGYEKGKADRPRGEWIDIDTLVLAGQCSVCRKWSDIRGNYCPWCGAHMKGADDEDN